MKKYVKLTLCGLAALAVVTGCSKKEESTAETTAAETSVAETRAEITDFGKMVKLGTYKGVEVTKMDTTVTEEDVDNQIEKILAANPEYIAVTDRAAQNGDRLDIDFVGKLDGEAFDGGTAEGYKLTLGSHAFIDGFEDGLVGAENGQKLDLNLTFPENYGSAELAGQAVVFEVTVNAIEEVKDAVMDDAFVQRVSDFNTVDEYRADVMRALQEAKEQMADQQLENDAYFAALNNSEYELNQDAVDQYYDEQIDYHNSIASMYGFAGIEDYASTVYQMDNDTFESYIRESAENAVKEKLMMEEIIKAENLVADDDDIAVVAEKLGMDAETMKNSYGEDKAKEYALFFQILDLIKENAVVK